MHDQRKTAAWSLIAVWSAVLLALVLAWVLGTGYLWPGALALIAVSTTCLWTVRFNQQRASSGE